MQDLGYRFDYHPPLNERIKDQHQKVRERTKDLATWMDDNLPEGREKSLVITHLEEAMMWANAAIARNQ